MYSNLCMRRFVFTFSYSSEVVITALSCHSVFAVVQTLGGVKLTGFARAPRATLPGLWLVLGLLECMRAIRKKAQQVIAIQQWMH